MHSCRGKPAIRPSPKKEHGGLGGEGGKEPFASNVRVFCDLETKAWIGLGSRPRVLNLRASKTGNPFGIHEFRTFETLDCKLPLILSCSKSLIKERIRASHAGKILPRQTT